MWSKKDVYSVLWDRLALTSPQLIGLLTFLTFACSFSESFSAFLASLSSCLEVNCDPQRKKCEYINKYPTLSYLLSDIGLRFSLEHTFNWKSVSVKRWWETESDIWSVYNINCHIDYMDKRAGHLTTHYIYRSCLPLNPIPCSSQNSLCANVNARGTLEIVI